jgi:hypothetical protein
MLSKIINLLPSKMGIFVIFKILDIVITNRRFWLKYYLNMLIRTNDYYKTLSALNSNKLCPKDLYLQFIEDAQAQLTSQTC